MIVEDCIHDLPVGSCTICLHGPTLPEPVTVVWTFKAKHDGQCDGCNLPIKFGQVVHKLSTGTVVHRGCE